jgi:AcrR family transcriptional regulator
MADLTSNRDGRDGGEARERVLEVAERLFMQRGYAAVTLRDIASDIGIHHSSLYHHVPGGKEELFVEVTERHLARHRSGLALALASAEPGIRARLYAAADWLLSQPPMDLIRMTYSDMPEIDPAQAQRLSHLAFDSLIRPIERELERARRTGEIAHSRPGLVAGGLVGMLESVHSVPETAVRESRVSMAHQLIDVLVDGLRPR